MHSFIFAIVNLLVFTIVLTSCGENEKVVQPPLPDWGSIHSAVYQQGTLTEPADYAFLPGIACLRVLGNSNIYLECHDAKLFTKGGTKKSNCGVVMTVGETLTIQKMIDDADYAELYNKNKHARSGSNKTPSYDPLDYLGSIYKPVIIQDYWTVTLIRIENKAAVFEISWKKSVETHEMKLDYGSYKTYITSHDECDHRVLKIPVYGALLAQMYP